MQPLAAGDPTQVGEYRLLRRLGAGGMGQVFLGRSPGGRTVAVKLVKSDLATDAEFRSRFKREVASARKVGGQWTAHVLDADTESEHPWVATRYIAGPSLSDAVTEFGLLPEHDVRTLTAGLAEALAVVHAMQLIHRDIKPSNVMLTPDGPKLIDFGIARAMDAAATAGLTQSGVVIGSPGYMSPEQVLGQPLGAASDVFQLGAVLVYAATGRGPFAAETAGALLYKVAHGEPDLGLLAGELRAVAADCLARDPAARPTPQQLAARLAPQGAAALVAAGWLPAPLLVQLSRRVSELLDLEAGAVEQDPATRRLAADPRSVDPRSVDPRSAAPTPSTPSPTPTAPATAVPPARSAAEAEQERLAKLVNRRLAELDPERNRVAKVLQKQEARREAEQARRDRWGLQDPQPAERRNTGRNAVIGLVALFATVGLVFALANAAGHGSNSAANDSTTIDSTPDYGLPVDPTPSPSASVIADPFLGSWTGVIPGLGPESIYLTIAQAEPSNYTYRPVTGTYQLGPGVKCAMEYQLGPITGDELQLVNGRQQSDSIGDHRCDAWVAVQVYLNANNTLRFSGGYDMPNLTLGKTVG
ncbi:serine/threonine-protein kinase [Kitasatospora sp. LaBMicrA B282]|uniref:serine/threonine-protein kinase n=1 Tax=Kitasatospora sp. LaBMicrA B282 TaxID=3420949 RepID=UPI003D0EB733